MNYELKDVFENYFKVAKKITLFNRIKSCFGFLTKSKSFYGSKSKLGDKVAFVGRYEFPSKNITEGTMKIAILFEREVERYCQDFELMSNYEKPMAIENELKHHIIRVVKKGHMQEVKNESKIN